MAPPGWPSRSKRDETRIVIAQQEDGTWIWKKVNTVGRIVSHSGDSYKKRAAAVQAAKREHPGVEIEGERINGFRR